MNDYVTLINPFSGKKSVFGDGNTKINANVGLNPYNFDIEIELEKAIAIDKIGADTIMDLSIHGNIASFQDKLTKLVSIPVCSNPIYETAVINQANNNLDFTFKSFIETLKNQINRGISCFTIHSGMNKELLQKLMDSNKRTKTTSRGGGIVIEKMLIDKQENPLFTHFDEILDIVNEGNCSISLGNFSRPASVLDFDEDIFTHELEMMNELLSIARKKKISIKVEAPIGHMSIALIPKAIIRIRKILGNVPIGTLGPLVTDTSIGYDHISHSIGTAIATISGIDFVSVITRKEHCGYPNQEDIIEAIRCTKIAIQAGMLSRDSEVALIKEQEINKRKIINSCHLKNDTTSDLDCRLCGIACPLKGRINRNNY